MRYRIHGFVHSVSSSLQFICEALVFEPLDVGLQICLDLLCSTLALDLKEGEHAFLGSVGGSFAAAWARMVLKKCSSERWGREKRF